MLIKGAKVYHFEEEIEINIGDKDLDGFERGLA